MSENDSSRSRRANRRGARRREIDYSVPSPCVKVCMFKGTPFCDGCFRTQDEIREWMIMTREEKLSVLERIALRKAES